MRIADLEALRVAGHGSFIDAKDGGYYVAMRAGLRFRNNRDAGPRFYGPFSTAAQASFLAVSAHALGLT